MKALVLFLAWILYTLLFVALALVGRYVFTQEYPATSAVLLVALLALIFLYAAILRMAVSGMCQREQAFLTRCGACGRLSHSLEWWASSERQGSAPRWLCPACLPKFLDL